MSNEKITAEFFHQKNVCFKPRTKEESAFIQQKLFDMGFRWRGGCKKIQLLEHTVAGGITVEKGRFGYGIGLSISNIVHAHAADFEGYDEWECLPRAKKMMLSMFNVLSDRLSAEQARTEKLEALADIILERLEPTTPAKIRLIQLEKK